jgi:hypothetical protein
MKATLDHVTAWMSLPSTDSAKKARRTNALLRIMIIAIWPIGKIKTIDRRKPNKYE